MKDKFIVKKYASFTNAFSKSNRNPGFFYVSCKLIILLIFKIKKKKKLRVIYFLIIFRISINVYVRFFISRRFFHKLFTGVRCTTKVVLLSLLRNNNILIILFVTHSVFF